MRLIAYSDAKVVKNVRMCNASGLPFALSASFLYFCHLLMKVSNWISGRLRLRKGGAGSPAAVWIAVAGVALALMVMEFTLAIVVGFKDGIRSKLLGFDAAVTVESPINDGPLTLTATLDSIVRTALPPDAELRLAIRRPGMLKTDTDFQGVVFLGQSPEGDFSFEKGNITTGEWPDYKDPDNKNAIVVSEATAYALGLGVGDKLYSTFIVDDNIRLRRHTVAALYQSDFGEYDKTIVYASLSGLQSVCGLDSMQATRLDIRGIAVDDIEAVAAQVQQHLVSATARGVLRSYYPVDNVRRTGALYFNWLALLDTNVAVIFALMLAVAGFTLVSSLFILILERLSMIGILRALGASKALVRSIFTRLGMRLTITGMIIGNVLGLGALSLQKIFHIVKLNPDMYYLAEVPVEFVPWAIVALNIGVAAAAWLILSIPAAVAADTDPSVMAASD